MSDVTAATALSFGDDVIAPPVARSRWTLRRTALLGAVLVYFTATLLLPLAALLTRALDTGLGAIARALLAPEALGTLGRSVVLVAIAVVVNGAFGVAGALVLVRHRFVGRRFLDALIDLPIAVSPVMSGLAFLLLFGRGGLLYPLLDAHDIKVAFAFPGLVIATLFVTLPLTLREICYVLEELGTAEEECAQTLGASPWTTFWRVTLPNIRQALAFGITLTTARALGEFGAVLVLGGAISGRTQTATTFIYNATEERQDAGAYGMALLLAVISIVLLLVLERLKRHSKEPAA